MNREQAKKLLPIMQAFVDGKDVEYYDEIDKSWYKIANPCFKHHIDYRVKQEPKYAPYNNVSEFLKDSKEHGPYIKDNDVSAILPVNLLGFGIEVIFKNCNQKRDDCVGVNIDWEELLNDYTWQDGSKCGTLVD